MKTVISLCDLTGNMVKPWIEAGYIEANHKALEMAA